MSTAGLQQARILVVANGEERDWIVSHLTTPCAGAVTASDAASAWRLLTEQSFDLVLIDLDLPDLQADQLIAFVRQQPRTRHMPIIVIASPNNTGPLDAAFGAGAGSVLMKPLHDVVFEHHIGVAVRMIAAAARLRVKAQQSVASYRAGEALLGNVCGEARAVAGSVRDEVERIWRSLPAAAATPGVVEALRRIGREVAALQDVSTRAEELAGDVRHLLTIVDRRETLVAIVERALDGVEMAAAEKGVRLVSDLPSDLVGVICDPAAVEEAVRNVLHNAIVYSPSDSNVSISASIYPDGVLFIDVTDEGEGMHPEYVARCLTPLTAGSLGGVSANGRLGFGLPLAKAIMEAHDGALEIRSMPGEGTTALLILPAERVMPGSPSKGAEA